MDLAGHITLGEILLVQAAPPELASKPALCFGDQQHTCAGLDAASASTVLRQW